MLAVTKMQMFSLMVALATSVGSATAGPKTLQGTSEREAPIDSRQNRSITVDHCLVSLLEQATVPAQDSGVLVQLHVREGDLTTAEALVAQIDDRQAKITLKKAQAEYARAEYEARNDITVRYARAVADVSAAELSAAEESNRKAPNSVAQGELRRLRLAHHRGLLGVEQAAMQQRLVEFQLDAREADSEAAQLALDQRQVRSPIAGLIVEIHKHVGEWVEAGEALLHIIRMDRLRVEAFLYVQDVGPQEVAHRNVTVSVTLDNGRLETFQGQVVFINPLVHAGGQYRIWAEVANRRVQGQYLLRPGHQVRMVIHRQDLEAPVEAPPASAERAKGIAAGIEVAP